MGFSRQEYWSGLPCPPPGGSPWLRDWTCVSSYLSCIGWGHQPPGMLSSAKHLLSTWWIKVRDQREKEVIRERERRRREKGREESLPHPCSLGTRMGRTALCSLLPLKTSPASCLPSHGLASSPLYFPRWWLTNQRCCDNELPNCPALLLLLRHRFD